MKPPLATLGKHKVTLADYIDDLITMNRNKDLCYDNINKIIRLLDSLGFVVHPEKSIFEPTQIIEFLGFIINTIDMTVSLTNTKKHDTFLLCNEALLISNKITIRYLSKILGKVSSSFLAVPHGKLHYRALERHKTRALKLNYGRFDRITSLPLKACQ